DVVDRDEETPLKFLGEPDPLDSPQSSNHIRIESSAIEILLMLWEKITDPIRDLENPSPLDRLFVDVVVRDLVPERLSFSLRHSEEELEDLFTFETAAAPAVHSACRDLESETILPPARGTEGA